MTVFVDTSAIVAALNPEDGHGNAAVRAWTELLRGHTSLITTNYVIVEALAVVRGRLGAGAVRALIEEIFPLLRVEWVEEETHARSLSALIAADRRGPSMVDFTSFEVMRRFGIRSAFTFDRHFRQFGFETVP